MKELRKYQSFNSITKMDNSISEYLSVYKLKESEYTVLWKIASYSCKFVGVSYLKVQTLADLVHYSKRTVQRSLKRLTELGIITRVESFKPVKGGHSAFINVINPFESHTVLSLQEEAIEPTPDCADEVPAHIDTITSKAKISNNKTYVDELGLAHLDAIGVPTQFSIAALPYLDVQAVYKLWSKVQMAAKKHAPDLVDTVEIAVSSVRASVLANKVKRIRDFTGYFYGVLAQKLSTAQRSLKCKLFNFLQ
ncbi:helix-turn-helix domain-containing protein [Bacillus cereus]|uniref:helix-turn-helix domain-containing protein n=1 Tax=Bacillus cereus TaxID=1396 RepID=UPI0018F4304F|nr:helix-turn-helix domain-containing protein [Bacillus cereus]MBJ8053373.1 helix-turn-helix domain-containing protein [Bacillus cereus]